MISNWHKALEKYNNVLLMLFKQQPNFFNFIDTEQIKKLMNDLISQSINNPEFFLSLNMELFEKINALITKFSFSMLNPSIDNILSQFTDKRFKSSLWYENTQFAFLKEFYLISGEFMQKSINKLDLDKKSKQYLQFFLRQVLDAFCPTNFIFSNPEVLEAAIQSNWQNVVDGLDNLIEDLRTSKNIFKINITDKNAFKFGVNIAATEGKVIMKNDLMELICYKPKEQNYSIPILIVPPCINKYYILDLSSHNSFVKWLVDNNFQVFLISWVNPDSKLKDKTFDDYIHEGVEASVDYIQKIFNYKKINAIGYCIGGIFLAIAMAKLKNKFLTGSFMTTLLDLSHPGDLGVFITENIVKNLEDEMKKTGYFDGNILAHTFSLLRANDLIWSFVVNNYLLGRSPLPFDVLYWNSDSANLPPKMYSFYLRELYIENKLKDPGKMRVRNEPIHIENILDPVFFIATKDDHIAPWRSVYDSMNVMRGAKKTFCLGSSGHVMGIINPPTQNKYNYWTNDTDTQSTADDWLSRAQKHSGSWWIYWKKWISQYSGTLIKSIDYSNIKYTEQAPGSYVKIQLI